MLSLSSPLSACFTPRRLCAPVMIASVLSGITAGIFSPYGMAQSTVVGSMPSEFSVSGGQAHYSIPIAVAPGRAGMEPDLSFTYQGGGNGILGVGWRLSGLSSITRCRATLAQDGWVGGITLGATDRYCLNGERLVPVNGSHGGIGTEYRTERDSYSQITAYEGSTGHPDYWVV